MSPISLISGHLLWTETGVALASGPGTMQADILLDFGFCVAFRSKIPQGCLSGLQAFSGPLVLVLSVGPAGKPKNFSATCWSLWAFPQIFSSAVTTSALRPWWIEHFIKIKASLRGSYYPPIPPSLPHLGACDPSLSGFRILQSGWLIFFRFSSSGGKQPLHLPSFLFYFLSLCSSCGK